MINSDKKSKEDKIKRKIQFYELFKIKK